jgi:hypothetical protein
VDDRLSFEDVTEPSVVPGQIIAPAPTIEQFGEAVDKTEAVVRSLDAADVPVGSLRPSDEIATAEHSIASDKLMPARERRRTPWSTELSPVMKGRRRSGTRVITKWRWARRLGKPRNFITPFELA